MPMALAAVAAALVLSQTGAKVGDAQNATSEHCVAREGEQCCSSCEAGYGGVGCGECLFDSRNGGCDVCTRDGTCSGHGDCVGDLCLCDGGWGGADCGQRVCSPRTAHWYTAGPNRPQAGERFTLIVHGCFSRKVTTGRQLKVVRANSSFTADELCAREVEDGCKGGNGTVMYGEAGEEVMHSMVNCPTGIHDVLAPVEPTAEQELLLNLTAPKAVANETSISLHVCYRDTTTNKWRVLNTNDPRGNRVKEFIVEVERTEMSGRRPAPLGAGGIPQCCDGLQIGELCLPAVLVIVVWVLLLTACTCSCIIFFAQRGQTQTPEQRYGGIGMDQGDSSLVRSEQQSPQRSPSAPLSAQRSGLEL